MRATGRLLAAVVSLVALASAGCARGRIESGVYHSPKGYRVRIPSGDWTVVDGGAADLELRRRDGQAGMLANASCDRERVRGPLAVLARHLLSGIRDRSVLSREDLSIDGRVAQHSVVEGRTADAGAPVKVEVYVVRDERCLYDFLYAAPPETFEASRPDFERLVRTLVTGE